MVRKLHAIVFMFYLPLLHTRQMVLHCKWRRVLLTMRRRKRGTDREKKRRRRRRRGGGDGASSRRELATVEVTDVNHCGIYRMRR